MNIINFLILYKSIVVNNFLFFVVKIIIYFIIIGVYSKLVEVCEYMWEKVNFKGDVFC